MIPKSAAQTAGFDIIETAPAGGSANVYKSRHTSTGNLCALKLAANNANDGVLQREATMLGQLSHPSIVRLFKTGFIESTPYLATHWINGDPLTEWLKQDTQFSEDRAIQLFTQIASALQHAHNKGVVHADISPANIIVDSKDHATLIDFGIGQQATLATVTASSDFIGTLRYVAPEVIQGAKATAASDQYSVAVILYELLTGSWPYDGEATAAAALHSHLYAEPVNAQERNPALSTVTSNVLSKSLNKDPDARFPSIADMAEALTNDTHCVKNPTAMTPGITPLSWRNVKAPVVLRSMGKGTAVVSSVLALLMVVWYQQFSAPKTNQSSIIPNSYASEISSECNLLVAPAENETGIVKNFYGPDNLPDRIRLFSTGKDQWRLEIGKANEYGLYGQIVKVQSDIEYQFSATVERDGYIHMPSLRIEWLDKDYQVQPELLTEYRIEDLQDGLITMPSVKVPDNAAYAVPTLYKDKTEGTMAIHSMFFRAVNCL